MSNQLKQGGTGLRPLGKETLTLRVEEAIKVYILNESLQPGDVLLSERQLCAALSVSRTVVRKALQHLVDKGIIVKQHGRGMFLQPFALEVSGNDISDGQEERTRFQTIREARAAVEYGAMGLICQRITHAEIAHLEEITTALEKKIGQEQSIAQDDYRFHLTLLQAAHNEALLRWVPLLDEVMHSWVYLIPQMMKDHLSPVRFKIADYGRIGTEHRAILEAVRQRDAEGARRALKQHLLIPTL